MSPLLAFVETASTSHAPATIGAFIVLRSVSVIWPPIPGFPMDLLGIGLFGPVKALLFAEIGIMLGASVAFGIARWTRNAGREESAFVLRRLQSRLEQSGWVRHDGTEEQQFQQWLLLRLVTNPLFDPISYVAGFTRTRFRPYFFGSLFGNLPSMIVFYVAEAGTVTKGLPMALTVAGVSILAFLYVARPSLEP